jgi:hypothetical protein
MRTKITGTPLARAPATRRSAEAMSRARAGSSAATPTRTLPSACSTSFW